MYLKALSSLILVYGLFFCVLCVIGQYVDGLLSTRAEVGEDTEEECVGRGQKTRMSIIYVISQRCKYLD
jgi:hypothetical protein